jgi:serine/threonine protein kinase
MESGRRAAFLEESCAGDDSLRREVESLIRHHESAGSFLETPVLEMLPDRTGMPAGERVSHYQIEEKLGEGGMGAVYKCHDIRLGRHVALKLVKAQFSDRWEREARAVAVLSHPHIATLYDVGRHEGAPYLVFECVSGQTLDKLIPRDGLPLSEALKIAVQVADGLTCAHSAGIVHRDLKPSNLIVDETGQVKVLDFGLAKLAEREIPEGYPPAIMAAQSGVSVIAGTPAYMSPEQAAGKPVDARSDIFSFGSLLYEMVTGHAAFPGDSRPAIVAAVLNQEPEPVPPTVPPELQKTIGKCLQKDPAQRFQQIDDVKRALDHLCEEMQAGTGTKVSTRSLLAVIGVVIVLAVLLIAPNFGGLKRGATVVGPTSLSSAQLTSGEGLDICAAFSPAGNVVAYASDRGGSFEIYVRSLDSSARELKLTSNGNQNLFPTFSPDGQQVAFSAFREPGIYRVSALGGSARRLTDFGAQPSWSPDGKWIVFRSEAVPSHFPYDYYWPAESNLWLVPADGGEPRQITDHNHPKSSGQNFPSWSPDGREIRFVNYLSNECSMWSYRIGDGSLRMLFSAGFLWLGSATFARDGRNLYYVSAVANGDMTIWRRPLNPNTLQPDGEPVLLYRPSVGVPRDLSLAPDGKHLAYSATLSESKLMKLGMSGDSPDGREPESLTHEASFRAASPSISPDGKLLTYAQNFKGQPTKIMLMSFADGRAAPIGSEFLWHGSPQFSQDGRFVFYVCGKFSQSDYERGKNGLSEWRFSRVRLADGAVQNLAPADVTGDASFSPDGAEVAFSEISDSVLHAFKLNFKSGVKTQLTSGPTAIAHPRYSRDGERLAVQVERPRGMSQIGLIPASGGAVRIVKDGGINFVSGFSPDDSKILYAGVVDGVWNIYWVSIHTHEVRRLTDYHHSRTWVRYPDWALKGDKIVYVFNESRGNVYVGELR